MTSTNVHDVDVNQLPIGETIRRARKRRGLTQTELAVKLGKSLRTVTTWEGGQIPPERIPDVEAALEIKLIEGRQGWIAVFAEDAPGLQGTAQISETDEGGTSSTDGDEGRMVLFIAQEILDELPRDVLEEARAAAHLQFLERARQLMSERRPKNE